MKHLAIFVTAAAIAACAPDNSANAVEVDQPGAVVSAETSTEGMEPVAEVRFPGEPNCTPTHQTEGWEFIENNGVRFADEYAVERNPLAAFAVAEAAVHYQVAGEDQGKYLLQLNAGNAFAQLEPLFDFCTPASELDDEGELWRVVRAKYLGRDF